MEETLTMTRDKLLWLMENAPNPRQLWEEDEVFSTLWSRMESKTLVDKVRCYNIYQCARHVYHLAGNAAELGVHRGGTARLMAESVRPAGRLAHLFDTFAGIPPLASDTFDVHRAGDFSDTSFETVQAYLTDLDNVVFHEGIFPDSTTEVQEEHFALVHLDCDIYLSIKAGLEFFYPRMVVGGIIVIDDYATWNCHGCTLAVDEFLANKPERPLYIAPAQAIIIKLPS